MKKHKKKSQTYEIWRRLKKSKTAIFGIIVIIIIVLFALFADIIAPYELVTNTNGKVRLQGPSKDFLFGTDALGRDIFARIIHGARVSLSIGVLTTLFSAIIGGALGSVAAFYGGKVDNFIMRIMDTIMSIPSILLPLAIIAALGASLQNLFLAIMISSVPGFVRIVRSVVITIVDQEFIEAAVAGGTSHFRIIYKHIIPNALGPVIVTATMSIARMILLAAGLSFIGMGVQPPRPEWGYMLSEARAHMRTAPHLIIFPGFFIAITALSFNLLGDGLRDALDPRLRD